MTESDHSTDADLATERLKRKREVALGYRIFAGLRWGDLGDGHITARDPERTDHFWMLRFRVPFERATVDDLLLVNPEGKVVEGNGYINTAGHLIHHPIHAARPDVVSAAHVHTPWGTPFSIEGRPIDPIVQEATVFFEDHAIFDDDEVQVQTKEGGQRIAAALGDNRALILRWHGLLTTGGSVAEAVALFVQMERVCEAHMKVPNAKPIPDEAARFAKSDLDRYGFKGSFGYLVARHVGDPTVVG